MDREQFGGKGVRSELDADNLSKTGGDTMSEGITDWRLIITNKLLKMSRKNGEQITERCGNE